MKFIPCNIRFNVETMLTAVGPFPNSYGALMAKFKMGRRKGICYFEWDAEGNKYWVTGRHLYFGDCDAEDVHKWFPRSAWWRLERGLIQTRSYNQEVLERIALTLAPSTWTPVDSQWVSNEIPRTDEYIHSNSREGQFIILSTKKVDIKLADGETQRFDRECFICRREVTRDNPMRVFEGANGICAHPMCTDCVTHLVKAKCPQCRKAIIVAHLA